MTDQPHDPDEALAPQTCETCDGTGSISRNRLGPGDWGVCPTCRGEGAVEPDPTPVVELPRRNELAELLADTRADDEARLRRASFHVVDDSDTFVKEALAGEMGDTAKSAARTATEDAMDRGYLADEARIAAGLYVLLMAAEVIEAVETS